MFTEMMASGSGGGELQDGTVSTIAYAQQWTDWGVTFETPFSEVPEVITMETQQGGSCASYVKSITTTGFVGSIFNHGASTLNTTNKWCAYIK